jgi:CRP-like cAMP-binding protein
MAMATDLVFNTGILVHLAMLGYAAGFLFRNQIVLRVFVLIATCLYIAYYYLHPAEPLWGAIFASMIIGAATFIGLIRVLASRMTFNMSQEDRMIFAALPGLEPGEFRGLMSIADRITLGKDTLLTKENERPGELFFTCSGRFIAEKGDQTFNIPAQTFVGEVSFMLNTRASASLVAEAGAELARWNVSELRALLDSRRELKQAFEALLARDMAAKVAASVRLGEVQSDMTEDEATAQVAITA